MSATSEPCKSSPRVQRDRDIRRRFGARSRVRPGQPVEVAVDARSLHFFDPETGLESRRNSNERGCMTRTRIAVVLITARPQCSSQGWQAQDELRKQNRLWTAQNLAVKGSISFDGVWTAFVGPEAIRRRDQGVQQDVSNVR